MYPPIREEKRMNGDKQYHLSGRIRWGAVCGLAGFLLAFFKLMSYDTWFHLAAGRYIWQTKLVPTADPFSFVQTNPWLYHSWLSGLLLYGVHALGSDTGLIGFKALVEGGIGVLLFVSMVRLGARPPVAAMFCVLGLFAFRYRMVARPMVFTTLFAVVTWQVLALHYARERCLLWLLPPMFVLWINLHPGAMMGLVMIAVHAFAEMLRRVRGVQERHAPLRLMETMALCAVAMLCNPYGVRILQVPFQLAQQRYYLNMTLEWQRMPFNIHFLDPFSPLFFYGATPFWVLLACALVGWVLTVRRHAFVDTLALWCFGALAVFSRRQVDIFVATALPGLAVSIRHLVAWREAHKKNAAERSSWRKGDLIVAALIAAAIAFGIFNRFEYLFGVGVKQAGLPVGGAAFLARAGIKGRVFDQWVWGNYLIWQGYPERKVFIDTRSLTYGEARFREYNAIRGRKDWEHVLSGYGVECLVIDHSWPRSFYNSRRWPVVFWDSECVVALRSRPENEPTIKRFACAESVPANITSEALRGPRARAIERQLREKIERNPECGIAHYHLGRLLAHERQYYLAAEEFRKTVRMLPRFSQAYHNLGYCLYRLRAYDEAIRYFKQAIRLNPRLSASYQGIGDCYDKTGHPEDALRWYAEALRVDSRLWSARKQRVRILLERGKREMAVRELEKMIRLGNREPDVVEKLRELGGGGA